MGTSLLYLSIAVLAVCVIASPALVAGAYLLNSLIQPQYLWPWIFNQLPVFKITAGLSILSFGAAYFFKKSDFKILKEKQNYLLISLLALMHISHILTPYPGAYSAVKPELVLDIITTIVLMYFIVLPLLNSNIGIRLATASFIIVSCYYIYWANDSYFSHLWYRFVDGRLEGIRRSPYSDANALAALVVLSLPFVSLLFFHTNRLAIRVLAIIITPLGWHALFLFSSRGALLGAVATLITIAWIVKSKSVNAVFAIAFIALLATQASTLLNRSQETVERGENPDEVANPRIVSWTVGLKLIPRYPIFGVGVEKYQAAASDNFPNMTPHVAHNTFINFSANTGLMAGLIYLTLAWLPLRRLILLRKIGIDLKDIRHYGLVSSSIGMIGFFVCSIFLDLIIFEPFYFLLVLNLISNYQIRQKSSSIEE